MGLDYSIKTFIKKDHLARSLKWLYQNSWIDKSEMPLSLRCEGQEIELKASDYNLIINGDKNRGVKKECVVESFESIDFATSLVFEMDPQIIECIAGWNNRVNVGLQETLKADFENYYLGDGKVRIGYFYGAIQRLKNHEVFEIDLMAATTDISILLKESIAVKKWILDFSENSNAIMTYLSMEDEGHKIMYYKGSEVDIRINGIHVLNGAQNAIAFFTEYFSFMDDTDLSPEEE